jgi:hypothetical protein
LIILLRVTKPILSLCCLYSIIEGKFDDNLRGTFVNIQCITDTIKAYFMPEEEYFDVVAEVK